MVRNRKRKRSEIKTGDGQSTSAEDQRSTQNKQKPNYNKDGLKDKSAKMSRLQSTFKVQPGQTEKGTPLVSMKRLIHRMVTEQIEFNSPLTTLRTINKSTKIEIADPTGKYRGNPVIYYMPECQGTQLCSAEDFEAFELLTQTQTFDEQQKGQTQFTTGITMEAGKPEEGQYLSFL
jgi:hypothetical protein